MLTTAALRASHGRPRFRGCLACGARHGRHTDDPMYVRSVFELFEEEVCHVRAADGEACAARHSIVRDPVASCEPTVRQPRRSRDGPIPVARPDYTLHLGPVLPNAPPKG